MGATALITVLVPAARGPAGQRGSVYTLGAKDLNRVEDSA